ncbi:MAG: XRE family transcriptional regulator [Clostridia bacterium]|nr:XRE family transcriptional regulator [Clostridia bacterium]
MTQKMLADAVGYSEKTVSKWETDGCIPPVETLFRIAGVFRTDLNTLFAGDDAVCFLGIDGGGTKTAFALADHEGNVLRRLRLDPCNPFDVGIERAKAVLEDGIRQICAGMPLSSVAVFAGLAGCKSGEFADGIDAFLQQFGFAMAALDSDNENIIAAGLAGRDGITVILGTGICSFAVQGMRHDRIAGWGYLFDEGGSAYNIGRDALSQYYSACDGSGETSGLTRRIREVTGCPETELLSRLYEGGKKRIASYATLVFEEAEKGDAAACAILRRNMGEAARIIRAALARFPETARDIPVVLAGGMTEQPLLLSYLREALGEECRGRLELLRVPPVDGALMKARTLWQEEYRHE